MIAVQIRRDEPPSIWDRNIAANATGGFFQATCWARLSKAVRGSEALYLTAAEDQQPVAQCLILKEGRFSDRVRRTRLRPWLLPLVNRLFPSLNWRGGPIFLVPPSEAIWRKIAEAVDRLAVSEKALSVEFAIFPSEEDEAAVRIWQDRGFEVRRQATYWVDLRADFEKALHRSVLKNIRKCQRQGVAVAPVSDEEWRDFYRLQQRFRRQRGLPGFSWADFMLHQELLGEHRVLFAARWQGRMIASLGIVAFNGLIFEVEAATDPLCCEHSLNAHDLLKCEVMHWGQQHGFKLFDLSGVAVEPRDAKEEGIRRFKEKFGGQYIEYHTFHREAAGGKNRLLRWGKRVVKGKEKS